MSVGPPQVEKVAPLACRQIDDASLKRAQISPDEKARIRSQFADAEADISCCEF
jgi:hypothetical protein